MGSNTDTISDKQIIGSIVKMLIDDVNTYQMNDGTLYVEVLFIHNFVEREKI